MTLLRTKWTYLLSGFLLWTTLLAGTLVACQSGQINKELPPNTPPSNHPGYSAGSSQTIGGTHQVDQSEFVYTETHRKYSYPTYDSGSLPEPSAADASAAPSAPDASTGPGTPGEPPSGRTDKVEEGNLYKTFGNTLFYLNTYKGLLLISLDDPKKPKKLSHLPVYGTPIEMFFDEDRAYVLVKESLYLKQADGQFKFIKRHGSELVIIDIKERSKPKIIKRMDIDGILREGVSRKVGDTLYVVSYMPVYYYRYYRYRHQAERKERTTVYSYDLSNPRDVKQVQSLELMDASRTPPSQGQDRHYSFSGITISATSNALMVAEQWYYYTYNSGTCRRSESFQMTMLNLVDISDPKGTIRVHTRFGIRGLLTDQFKQSYAYDANTRKGIYYGIFQRNEWSSNCNNWQRVVKNTLISVDISDGDKPVIMDQLAFGKPNESVKGSLFDHSRKVIFAITAVQTDPFYVLSFADPTKLKVLSEIDGLSGDINVFRPLGKGFLMGIGRDNSGHCTGFQGTSWRSTQVAVSIFDVQKLDKARLVQRKCVEVNGNWSSSEINWNLDQAHKMIGMISDGTLNAVSVPVSYYTRHGDNRWWWGRWQTAIGLMSWDLGQYDESKDEKNQKVLNTLGTINHPNGQVKRTILLHLTHKGSKRRYALNLSDTHLSLADIQDPKEPKLLSTLELTPYISRIYRFGTYYVEFVGSLQNDYGYDNHVTKQMIRVRKASTGALDQMEIIKSISLGHIDDVQRWGQYIVLTTKKLDQQRTDRYGYPYFSGQQELVVYDFSQPTAPVLKGTYPLTARSNNPYYRYRPLRVEGGQAAQQLSHNNAGQQSLTLGKGLVLLGANQLHIIDPTASKSQTIALPKNDKVAGHSDQFFGLVKLDNEHFYVLQKEYLSKKEDDKKYTLTYRFMAVPYTWQNNTWTRGTPNNIPGRLLFAQQRGQQVYLVTHDNSYIGKGDSKQLGLRLNILKVDGDKARLVRWGVFSVESHLEVLALNGHFFLKGSTYIRNSDNGYYGYWEDYLHIVKEEGKGLHTVFKEATGLESLSLAGAYGNTLFFKLGSEGVLVADVSDPKAPKGLHFLRSQGWIEHISMQPGEALAAAGRYGVVRINLTQSSIPMQ